MTIQQFSTYLVYFSTYLLLLPVSISIYRFVHLTVPLRIVAFNLYVMTLLLIGNLASLSFLTNNRFVLYIYVVIDIVFQCWFFRTVIRSPTVRMFIGWITGGFLVYVLLDAFYLTGYKNLNSYSITVEALICALMLLYFIYELLSNTGLKLLHYPITWIITGFLINTFTTLLSIFGSQLLSDSLESSQIIFFQLNNIIYLGAIIAYLLYGVGFWFAKRI